MFFHSSIEPIYFILPILGFIIGLFGTMLGGGGGFFFLPILTLLIGVPMQTAVVTSLVATLPICLVGAVGHYRKGNIDSHIGALFAVAGILGAFVGAGITSRISAEQLKGSFGIYSMLIALNMVYSTWRKKDIDENKTTSQNAGLITKVKGSFYGLVAGIITGTFGTSGTAPVLAGLFTMNISLKLVIGTSLMVVLANTIFAVGAHLLVDQIDLTLVYFLTVGSIIGALIGPKIISKSRIGNSENNVRYIYAIVMVAIGVLMIVR